jgi:hypothetical protein
MTRLEDVGPERVGRVDVAPLHRNQVAAVLHERELEFRQVQARGVGIIIVVVADLRELTAARLAKQLEPPSNTCAGGWAAIGLAKPAMSSTGLAAWRDNRHRWTM